MTDFCGIPLVSLRENSITELDLEDKGVGVPGAIVLSKLLPSAAALTSLKYASPPKAFAFVSAPADGAQNPAPSFALSVSRATALVGTMTMGTSSFPPLRGSLRCARG